jgi:hypothetical protein
LEKEEWVTVKTADAALSAGRPSFEVRFRIHKQATGLVWIGFLRPASPLRDSAGVSPDFAGLSTAHHFTDALIVTVAETDTGAHNRVLAFTPRSQ